MVSPAAGKVVLVPFPFSDLSRSKLRPAVVLADASRGDWVLCQVTGNPYGDPVTISLTDDSFAEGSLRIAEVREVLASPGEDRPGRDGSRVAIGQTDGGRFLRVIYLRDPEPDSIFVITAYDLRGKPLKAYRRRLRKRTR